jgi:hypothetical protein
LALPAFLQEGFPQVFWRVPTLGWGWKDRWQYGHNFFIPVLFLDWNKSNHTNHRKERIQMQKRKDYIFALEEEESEGGFLDR